MLKNPPTSDDARDETADNTHSERRMRQSLEALSGPPLGLDEPQPDIRPEAAFRQDRAPDRGPDRNFDRLNQRRDLRDNAASKGRHRFVKDGEVPVVHLAPPRPRDATVAPTPHPNPDLARLKDQLEEHRARLEQAERALRDTQAQLRALQTKCAHTEMALTDATALAESRLHELEALRERLRPLPEPGAAPTGDEPPKKRRGRPPGSKSKPKMPPPPASEPASGIEAVRDPEPQPEPAPALPGRRGRPPGPAKQAVIEPEQEPVQWWLLPPKTTPKGRRRG